MVSTRQISGINEFTAPQGATVAGGCTTDEMTMVETCEEYNFYQQTTDPATEHRIGGVALSRHFGTTSTAEDSPKATGVTIGAPPMGNAFALATSLMAIFGEALDAMVQNVGQTDDGYRSVGGTNKVLSQGFTTGSGEFGYRLQGVGVNIEGSESNFPDGPLSVSVAVHADLGGKPGAKLFDLLSPGEFGAGHSFFEAPPGAQLRPDTSYVMVWRHLGGTVHRMRKTDGDDEDTGAATSASIADTFYQGADLANLSADQGSDALEIAVYTVVNSEAPRPPFVPGGVPVTERWLHIPEDVGVGYQFRLVFVTHRGILPTSGNIDDYNAFVQEEAAGTLVRGEPAAAPYTDPVIRAVADDFRAVVCTADDDARTNTEMPTTAIGVAIHWLDGGWDDRPTLIAGSYDGFYGGGWDNTEYGAYVTGNSAYFEENAMVWTGCDSSGVKDPMFPMGDPNSTGMVAAGSPRNYDSKLNRDPDSDRKRKTDLNLAPVGAVDVDVGRLTGNDDEYRPLYGISPIFTVVRQLGVDAR